MEKKDSKSTLTNNDSTTTPKYDMWAKFSEDQKYLFDLFKEKMTTLPNIDENIKSWLTDTTLWRYLRARQWSLKKAESMLTESIKWRQEFKPHEITREDILPVLELKTMYRSGKDLNRNPLLVITPGGENPNPVEKRIKGLVYTIEECVASMEEEEYGVEKISIICDFSEYGSRARSPDGLKVAKQSIHILQNHYPERLGRALIINPPWFFHMLFKLISPWLDPVTKTKIYWIKGDKEALRRQLSEFIDPSELEVKFGGDREKTIEEDLIEKKRIANNKDSTNNIINNININNADEKEVKPSDSKKNIESDNGDLLKKNKKHSKSKLKTKKHSKAKLNTTTDGTK